MEALWKSLRKGSSTAWTGEDHVYENIEAPKFVDFSAPIVPAPTTVLGCDQNHDEVDPDVLHKNFVLRVMAARSPNVRLQKALSRHDAPSAKCPRSAPAKSAKSRIGMLAEKAGSSARLKNYPVACLSSSTPKPPAKRPPAAAKALSTPRNRARPTGEEAFRSNRAAVKVLSFHTPKKSEKGTCAGKAPIPEISAGMKKLNMGTLRSDNAIDRDACRLLEAEECPERALPSSMTPSEDRTGVKSSPKAEAEEPDVFEDEPMEGSSEFDENKENASVIHAAADRLDSSATPYPSTLIPLQSRHYFSIPLHSDFLWDLISETRIVAPSQVGWRIARRTAATALGRCSSPRAQFSSCTIHSCLW
ncbi:unnamed protein product [Spirodela intermedia]|uniref:Uncharacterized protein n=1 Tax=Spirodela intermedia TaxID=51605 RepID=A0A7I8I7E1_SPIIN|nr:unnamed protein product [Spirodela intermedia]CAA6653485.1 unnamed protein product [Spirodela intermedia]